MEKQISRNMVGNLFANAMTLERQATASQRAAIKEKSPFSDEINEYISSYDEFYHLYNLGLKEAIVTRKSLIRDIDLDLYVTSRQATNKELMLNGRAPFACDSLDGEIELHHIGQDYDAPYAELTKAEHMQNGNSSVLHDVKKTSWRKSLNREALHSIEKSEYWKRRAKGEFELIPPRHTEKIKRNLLGPVKTRKISVVDIAISKIFKECSIEDLKYYRNLANNLIMLKEIEANTLEEFIIKNQNENTATTQIQCVQCGSKKYQEYGTYKSGIENIKRYRCKDCGKTYSILNNSIISGCKFTILKWLKFIDCLYNGFSIKKTAELCRVSKQTVHENRLKLFYALKLLNDNVKLQGNVVIDETFFVLSYKGNHSKNQEFIMPRNAHKRGKDNLKKGLSKDYVCVVCALDEFGNSVARTAGLGPPSQHRLSMALQGVFDKESDICIYSDKERALKNFAEKQDIPICQATLILPNSKKKNISYSKEALKVNKYLQKMNAYHSRLKKYIGKVGVSSDLLSGYLYLFSWKERSKNQPYIDSYKELLSVLTKPGLYKDLDSISAILSVKHYVNSKAKTKGAIIDFERAEDMFNRWGNGETQQSIADSYGVSRSTVAMSIKRYRELGYGCKTEREKLKEDELERKQKKSLFYTSKFSERNQNIYDGFVNSNMSNTEYYEWCAKEYGLSVPTVAMIVSRQKKIRAYQDAILIYEKYEYKDANELCSYICNRCDELVENDKMNKKDAMEIIAKEIGYKSANIRRIISEVQKHGKTLSTRTPSVEIINRDKAIYRDYMDWNKTEKEFWAFAEDKYKIKKLSLQAIINMMWEADPKRYVNKLD